MPEETSAPNPPASRRRNAPEESGGGGSKVLAIILGLLVLGLGFALFKRNSAAAAQTEKYTTEIATLKSNLLELTTRLAKETNNAFVAHYAERFAERLGSLATTPEDQSSLAYELALGRPPTPAELLELAAYAREHGLANLCRVVFNSNEFMFVN